ncbi:D-inositol-3-phosphate glycosyltransferase [Brevundimonas sp. SH203]|uniref:glycosyltransferase n=1 Tax=Brevundimonas sp. SH203 TaxID=345167 RepID=UPI0009CE66DD|nr:glycosyltransferase [Brevundimonas sp. SH203]GAW40330.1 D-inositol-3-phosphate glycosyltransferase [Brevundimonas sp. SH203]
MRVLIVNTLYPPADIGGAERSVAQLAEGLAAAGVETSVLTLSPGDAAVERTVGGVVVHRRRLRNLYWPYDGEARAAMKRALWHGLEAANPLMDGVVDRVAAQVQPDLVHLHLTTGFSQSVHRAAARRGLPLVQTLRDWSMMCARASMFRQGARCSRRCASCVMLTAGKRARSQGVDHVIGLSRPVLEAHRDAGYFCDSAGSVIGNAAPERAPTRRPGWSREPVLTFGFLGRVEAEKGIETLLRATTRLKGDWRLRIGGRGDAAYSARLRAEFPDPRIVWLGQVGAGDFWPTVDVLVAPALWAEPFGRAVAEAVQQGRGVIASRIGGLPEAAEGAGASALVQPGDVAALAQAMQAAMSEPERWRFAASGPSRWTEAAVVEAHLAIYDQLLSRRASRTAADRDQL